jgi:hypothetical protein
MRKTNKTKGTTVMFTPEYRTKLHRIVALVQEHTTYGRTTIADALQYAIDAALEKLEATPTPSTN